VFGYWSRDEKETLGYRQGKDTSETLQHADGEKLCGMDKTLHILSQQKASG